MQTTNNFDVIIVGGSYAGLAAAMSLGRSLRKVLVIDSGKPCNRQTPHSHNFLTQDGKTPYEIREIAKTQVLAYKTVSFIEDKADSGFKNEDTFFISTETGATFSAKKVVFATGIKDIMPNIKGFAECWGISVVHCPYCHGYEIRHKKTGIIANGERAYHLAPMVNNLTKDICMLTNEPATFSSEQLSKLRENNLAIVEKKIVEVEHENGSVNTIVFEDGSKEKYDALYAALPFVQHSDIPVNLGCELNEEGYIQVNAMYQTTVEGVFACGDNAIKMRSLANSIASGTMVGAVVNMELAKEQF
ncbi:NAD(P)/FAD-dependent oxidoreductase [Maribacter ulvicola]|uniref:Thioredoxin reductase n=1 Tax=Maribacter ulvicola TaxID=228959 RepID=A0A1N6RW29_9FLAO|nr:NAD(P)/FAD-dependent oxidoreductase [Maribacter ulvicola]SIQ33043.1 Thioredoxin reductase [Maribacter ulvicola]